MTKVSPHTDHVPLSPPSRMSLTFVLYLDLDILIVAEEDMTKSFIFDFTRTTQATNAVVFARQLLLQEMAKRDYNMLLTEG